MILIDAPFRIDARGRTATATPEKHVRDLIEQILFTSPGERVMRPDFGSGLAQLVFAPGSEALAATTQVTVEAALSQNLGRLIELAGVAVAFQEPRLIVEIRYRLRATGRREIARFERTV
jgi:phage baseplate assembly protein W